jgi:tRNA threonylcarbamoyladenosine biosynthesis protein TsaE
MSTDTTWQTLSTSSEKTEKLGALLGSNLCGGETIELIGDLGSGKTTFVRGLAKGFGSSDKVASPSFMLSKVYKARGKELHHFDFYRLSEPGNISYELAEAINDPDTITAVEWAGVTQDALPAQRLTITFSTASPDSRELEFRFPEKLAYLLRSIHS